MWNEKKDIQNFSIELFCETPSLLPSLCCPRLEPVAEHLPERHGVGPDVGSGGELQEVDALWGAPRDGQLQIGVEVGLVVILADAESARKAKIGNFDSVLGENEDVARGQVSVDQPLGLQVSHAFTYLQGEVGIRIRTLHNESTI